uniref:Arf-GAP domain-containing protein n=1 Tax=Eucampia antarctica TaxID=49252 RepID=A0A7S2R4Y6_9STRA|mmetsp:Transcript_17002/g.16416  ORF Transcript_17002/g.16416 Transcript_17002/m.16416 type:complete len:230 (+) Transcript_17002:203-892(+)
MPPLPDYQFHDENISSESLLFVAASELNELRAIPLKLTSDPFSHRQRFPSTCRSILDKLPGNNRCVDCNGFGPEWATVTYGALLCIECSGRHRRLGVKVSYVKSIDMDSWSDAEVLAMLEGGNKQVSDFFERHSLLPGRTLLTNAELSKQTERLYRTNAALFYRKNLSKHVRKIRESGGYKGRKSYRNAPNNYGEKNAKSSELSSSPESTGIRRRVQVINVCSTPTKNT